MTINKETRVAACLMFLSGGVTRTDVAKQFGVDNSTVADWLRRLEEGGEDALDYPHADRKRKNHLLDPETIYMAMVHCQKRSIKARLSRLLYLANGSTLAQVSQNFGITKQAVMKDRSMWLNGNFPTQNMTTIPTRIQRRRAKGATTPENTKYCGRPGRWGNPFVVNKHNANYYRVSVDVEGYIDPWFKLVCFELYISAGAAGFKTKREAQAHAAFLFGCLMNEFPNRYRVVELSKYTHLSCWCKEGEPCHVDEILKRLTHHPDAGKTINE